VKDIRIEVADSEASGPTVRLEHDYVPDGHVAMALVRAVNGACTQLGTEPPAELFARAAEAARPPEPTRVQALIARAQIETINRALAELGYGGEGAIGVIDAIAKLEERARVAQALGDGFAGALAHARNCYELALTGLAKPESAEATRNPDPAYVRVFRDAALALGHLLAELRKIDPEPVDNGDGTTTVTLTEAVEIGTNATAPEATS
jgi:hypothetical protein